MTGKPAVHVEDVTKIFKTRGDHSRELAVLNGVRLEVERGRCLGIVGESGSGKSTLGRIVAGLLRPTSGIVTVNGRTPGAGRTRAVQMVFQDPRGSLDPRRQIGASVVEALRGTKREERDERLRRVLSDVGLPSEIAKKYPHEVSGGEAQRACIARAIISDPSVIVLDEAVTSLDVFTQAEVLRLLGDIKERLDVAYLFISHDLRAVRTISDNIAVLYAGSIVEVVADVVESAYLHPYSIGLHNAELTLDVRPRRWVIGGEPPNPAGLPSGCTFHPRCPAASEHCDTLRPVLAPVEGDPSGAHLVACHYPGAMQPTSEGPRPCSATS